MEEKRFSELEFMKHSLECRNNWIFKKICAFRIPGKFDIEQLYQLHFMVIYPLGKINTSSGIQTVKACHPQEKEVRLAWK